MTKYELGLHEYQQLRGKPAAGQSLPPYSTKTIAKYKAISNTMRLSGLCEVSASAAWKFRIHFPTQRKRIEDAEFAESISRDDLIIKVVAKKKKAATGL